MLRSWPNPTRPRAAPGTLAQSEARRAMSAEATALLREAKQSAAVRDFLIALFTDMDHARPRGATVECL